MAGRFVSSLLFINLFNYAFLLIWTHGYIFYTLGFNPVLFYFVGLIPPALVIGKLFLLVLISHYCVVLFFCALLYFFVLQDVSCPSCIFSVPVLDSAISPRSPSSFYYRILLETKTEMSLLLGSFSWQSMKIYVYIYISW